MTVIDYILASFSDVSLRAFDIPKLRGYFAAKYPDDSLLHNHLGGDKFSYRAPQIQYRIHKGSPALLGFGDGIELIKKIVLDNHNITIGDKSMRVNEIQVDFFREEFGQSEEYYNYKFASPWMALNQENYKDYVKMNTMDQKRRLRQILKGNLLTLSKAFDYIIPAFDEIETDGWFKPVSRNFHNIPMNCFTGEFSMNFRIPEFLALGKQVARGFGVVRIEKEER